MAWVVLEPLILQGGAITALIAVLMFVAIGRLVPASTVDRITNRYDAELARVERERDAWKAAYEQAMVTNATNAMTAHTSSMQVERLLNISETTDQMVRTMKERLETMK